VGTVFVGGRGSRNVTENSGEKGRQRGGDEKSSLYKGAPGGWVLAKTKEVGGSVSTLQARGIRPEKRKETPGGREEMRAQQKPVGGGEKKGKEKSRLVPFLLGKRIGGEKKKKKGSYLWENLTVY